MRLIWASQFNTTTKGLKDRNSKALISSGMGHKKAVAILSCLQENDMEFHGQRNSECKCPGLEKIVSRLKRLERTEVLV